ncbi:MAG: exodeoxyribonuclease VII large subunit [Pseudomonadota bacterium]
MSGGSEETVLSVAELDRRLRRAVEAESANCWVEGEIGSLKRASSGHVYFTLKDEQEDAIIECVLYKLDAMRARRILADGARIQLFGRATVWAPRGRLQFVGQRVRPAGRGALLLALEELKKKLAAEGLFAPSRKRPLPADPSIVGVVTSAAGAAFADIRTVAFRRGRVRLVLAPAQVQGDGAVESLLRAIDAIERYPGIDVIIVGRGGGSSDDLMAFNDERVVRRLAAVRVPVVSAVGHEIDVSLTDLVADCRAATPSQAAELVVPDEAQRRERLARCQAALVRCMRHQVVVARSEVHRLRARMSDPRFLLAERKRDLDELELRLRARLSRTIARRRHVVSSLRSRLLARHPRAVILASRAELGPLSSRLRAAIALSLRASRADLAERVHKLDALSPLAVLGRGYAIALGPDGRALIRARDVRPGERVGIRLSEGRLETEVRRVHDDEEERT